MARFQPFHHVAPPYTGTTGPAPAIRVRELTFTDRTEQAVHLVHGEAGMRRREAEPSRNSL